MSDLRDLRQREFAEKWLQSRRGIMLISPRMGKTRIAIFALQTYNNNLSVLIVYPDNKIRKSWEDEFLIMGYDNKNITFTTYLSLHKYKDNRYDVVILDEIHLMSENQIVVCQELLKLNHCVMGLTGTLARDTRALLMTSLGLRVIAEYSIEQAIKEGVIADYEISVVTVPLDDKVLTRYGKNFLTEKNRFKRLTWVIDDAQKLGRDTKFLRFTRMRLIQSSIAKINKTRELIDEYKNERLLVFTGLTKVADSLQIPSYHSGSSDKSVFKDFVEGRIQYLAVCKIGNTGVTYTPLNRVIINYTDSNPQNLTQKINRCLSMEYDNPEKKGLIIIISSNEETELSWIRKGLSFFSKEKIKYL